MYIIKEREFINARSPVFKVGYSDALPVRMKSYPKGSIILATMRVNNGRSTERKVLAALRSQFIHRRDIGSEYFEGPLVDIVHVFHGTCLPMMSDIIELTVDSVNSPAVMEEAPPDVPEESLDVPVESPDVLVESPDVPVESPDDVPEESPDDGPDESLGDSKRRTHVNLENKWENKWSP